MTRPIDIDGSLRRAKDRQRFLRRRAREVKVFHDWCCHGCGDRHGRLIDLGGNTYYRIVIEIVHRDGNPENWRWANLAALCQKCRRASRIPSPAAAKGQGGGAEPRFNTFMEKSAGES